MNALASGAVLGTAIFLCDHVPRAVRRWHARARWSAAQRACDLLLYHLHLDLRKLERLLASLVVWQLGKR